MERLSVFLQVAKRHNCVVTRRDLLSEDLSSSTIQRARKDGLLEKLWDGTYFVGPGRPRWEQRLLGAVRATEPHGVVGGASAAALLRFDGFGPGRLELVIPNRRQFSLDGVSIRRSRDFEPKDDVWRVDGLPCTRVARTLLDLVPIATESQLVLALESVRRNRPDVFKRLPGYLRPRAHGRGGVLRLIDLVVDRMHRPPTDDRYEVLTERLLNANNLYPTRQVRHRKAGGKVFARVDFHFSLHRVVLEVDGFRTHSGAVAIRNGNIRDAKLLGEGFVVVHTTPWDVVNRPDELIADLRAVLDQRHPERIASPMADHADQLWLKGA